MSNLYNLEPQPTAKIIVHTTSGDLSLELFAKQTPLASRNFLQHCLNGYYDNTIFHRLVPGFIVQGGDPTGTGSGGISAINNGEPFADEFHSRLKFNRRGLLGSANEGKDSNGSQFFLTLGITPELQGKHTMFGRIEGDTIYNLMKIGEAELVDSEGSDRPLYPTKITSTEIIINPFEDMVARIRTAPVTLEGSGKIENKKRKKPLGKNVLSFAAEEEDGSGMIAVSKRSRVNPKLVDASGTTPPQQLERPTDKRSGFDANEKTVVVEPDRKAVVTTASAKQKSERPASISSDSEDDLEEGRRREEEIRSKKLEKTNEEIAALKASMRRDVVTQANEPSRPKKFFDAMVPATSTKGRRRGNGAGVDEKGALDLFKAFKSRLEELPVKAVVEDGSKERARQNTIKDTKPKETDEGEEEALCDLHFIANCQSCRAWNEDVSEDDSDALKDDEGGAWMTHRLTFIKDTLGKDLEWKKKMAEIEVIDPREKTKAILDAKRKAQRTRPG